METINPTESENSDAEKPAATPPSASEELSSKAIAAYEWWDNLATFHPDDPLWLGGAKILVRIIGILVLLALSPLIILGFMFAFLAVA